MGKIVDCVCIRDTVDNRQHFEKGRTYPIDLKTHPCAEYFRAVEDVPDPGNPEPVKPPDPDRRKG